MTQREQVRRLLNGSVFPRTYAEISAGLGIPQPTVRRIINTERAFRVGRYRLGLARPSFLFWAKR